ncbi:MAG: fructosamine kinase family protein [Anaerolineae bacterium]
MNIEARLRAALDTTQPLTLTPVSGGSINRAARVQAGSDRYFVKSVQDPPPGFFALESEGLRALTVRVPQVIAVDEHFLLLEWIESASRTRQAARRLGEALAQHHARHAASYGWPEDNFIGSLHQPNSHADSWAAFYAEKRLQPQREQAAERGRLPTQRARLLDRLIERMDDFLDEPPAAVLHGDLWGGNWLATSGEQPVLIDPAVYRGDPEVDLAMARLFGGFPPSFFEAYDGVLPPRPGAADRVELYQLYYLLVHLNLFGESYGGSVDRILQRYLG